MRQVLNISLPEKMADEVREEVKKGNFSSVSEFFRMLIRKEKEERLLKEIKQSEKNIKEGKIKKLKSLSDLK